MPMYPIPAAPTGVITGTLHSFSVNSEGMIDVVVRVEVPNTEIGGVAFYDLHNQFAGSFMSGSAVQYNSGNVTNPTTLFSDLWPLVSTGQTPAVTVTYSAGSVLQSISIV